MKNKKLLILALVTLAVILAAAITAKMRAPQTTLEKHFLFPGLTSQINQITRVTIQGSDGTVVLKKQQDKNWVLESSDNYPALFAKVRATLLSLADLRTVGEKTDNPELYSRLGVEGPEHEDTSSLLLTLKNQEEQIVAAIIIGDQRQSSSSKPGLYVRKPEQSRALLAEGSLTVSANDADWFERNLINIPPEDVKSVKIQYPDSKKVEIFKEAKEQPDFELFGAAVDNESAMKIIVNRISTGLEEMRADGVKALENFSFPDDSITTTVITFNGLTVTVKLSKVDDNAYAHFTFTTDPSAVRKDSTTTEATNAATQTDPASGITDTSPSAEEQARILTEYLSSWVYRIPDFKYEALTSNPEDLKNPFQTISE